MRITALSERPFPISRYNDPSLPPGGLTTSCVALTTDVIRCGKPIVGYGFGSIGRYAQSGLIRERFALRLLDAADFETPQQAWKAMMAGEKPGGHGERCVAVGTLDMALWDAAAKVADLPLHAYVASVLAGAQPSASIQVYAAGGYLYPHDDERRLADELRAMLDLGCARVKIKIGQTTLERDLRRIETALALLPGGEALAVDAMNAYDAAQALEAARALECYGLWWFEDVCDPLDFETQSAVAAEYSHPIAAGEALFSVAEAKLLDRYGGLRRDRDILLFDPVHCYGLTGYAQILRTLERRGWPRSAFWPHGRHLFTLHVVRALGLGGAETNPFAFAPFGYSGSTIPDAPGIGFETIRAIMQLFSNLSST